MQRGSNKSMELDIHQSKDACGRAAAQKAAEILKTRLAEKNIVRFIAATGASQFEFLEYLTSIDGIDWTRTVMFHLDEYVGIPQTHPASFCKYLVQRFVDKVHPGQVHLIQGDAPDPQAECDRVGALLSEAPIDEIVVTDTIPLNEETKKLASLKVLTVSEMLGEAIKRIHRNESISRLFK